MTEQLPQLAKPKEIPKDEWTQGERERGATYPEHITPLRARVKTPEQQYVFEQLEKRARQYEQELFERWPEPWQLSRDQMNQLARQMRVQFLEMARDASYLSDSYRNFDVGGVLIGYQDTRAVVPGEGTPRYANGTRPNPWRVLFDANTRPATNGEGLLEKRHSREVAESSKVRKYCAELYLTDRIDPSKPEVGLAREKLTGAVAMYLAGEPQTDNDSQREQITLTSCKLCRDRFWKKTRNVDDQGKRQRPVYDEEMPVISADIAKLENWEWQQINSLHKIHGEKLPPGRQEL